MTNLEKFHDFYDSNSDDVPIQQQTNKQTKTTTKKAGPRRLALAQPQK